MADSKKKKDIEYIDGLPVIGTVGEPLPDEQSTTDNLNVEYVDGLPIVQEPDATQEFSNEPDTLTEIKKPWYAPVTEGIADIPDALGKQITGIASAIQNPGEFVDNLLKTENLTRTGGAVAGGLVGGIPGTIAGDFLANQFNQATGISEDTPIGEDIKDTISGAGANSILALPGAAATRGALKPIRQAQRRAESEWALGAKTGTPKGTTERHMVRGEDMRAATNDVVKYNPFEGIHPNDPNGILKAAENTTKIKNGLLQKKNDLLDAATQQGVKMQVGISDIDNIVAELRDSGRIISDDAVLYAKRKLLGELNSSATAREMFESATREAQGDFKPFKTKAETRQLTEGIDSPDTMKSLSPLEAQDYMRRNIDGELKALGVFDEGHRAKILTDPSVNAKLAAQEGGLKLVREVLSRKIDDTVEFSGGADIRNINRGISSMIDLEEQLRMAQSAVSGAEVVMPGNGVPNAINNSGSLRSFLSRFVPEKVSNYLANSRRTTESTRLQNQMLGPIQQIIRFRNGTPNAMEAIGLAANKLVGRLGGAFNASLMSTYLIPRQSQAIKENPQMATETIYNKMYAQAMQKTGGNQEISKAIAGKTAHDFMTGLLNSGPEEADALIAATAKLVPGAFQQGEYPDEVNGKVFEDSSKVILKQNAKMHLEAGKIDSITYAKQAQEAWRNGPSRIILHKDGRIEGQQAPIVKSPELELIRMASNGIG